MRFYFDKGKQHLDLSGNLILSSNPEFISAPAKSAAPRVHRARYIMVARLSTLQRVRASYITLRLIWGWK